MLWMLTMQCPNKDQNWLLISESRYCVKCEKHSYKNKADILWKIIFLMLLCKQNRNNFNLIAKEIVLVYQFQDCCKVGFGYCSVQSWHKTTFFLWSEYELPTLIFSCTFSSFVFDKWYISGSNISRIVSFASQK